jgi:mRNA interferase MazF
MVTRSVTGNRKQRVFVVVSRQALSTQVRAGTAEGLKKESSIHCDDLVSLPKSALTNYVGSLKTDALARLDMALMVALGLD